MKKLMIAAAMMFSFSSFATEPNEKVLEAFQQTFHHATEVRWTEIEKNYEASFRQDEIILKVQYDKEGNLIKSLRYYNGNVLPIFIQGKLQKKYQGKTIYNVTEVTQPGDITYYIILEDAFTWMHVESDAYGNLRLSKKLKKG
jgi:hypothetical protein